MRKAEIDLNDVLIGFGYGDADTSEVPAATMAIARTRSGYADAEQNWRRALYDYNGTRIVAPFTGKVANVKGRVYESAPSENFCSVKISPFNAPDKIYAGHIISVNPTVDDKGRIEITASVSNADGSMMDGMNVRVMVEEIIPCQQVVPKSAVVMRDNQDVLFVYQSADSTARWVYVDIVMSNSDSHVVKVNEERTAELNLGDAVITSGNLNLAHESKVIVRQ